MFYIKNLNLDPDKESGNCPTDTFNYYSNTVLLNACSGESDESCRDQGLVRPRVLIILPFKESCRWAPISRDADPDLLGFALF
jgi:hypothetical protein